eukprot:m.371317 g.371317  ORF g.371317 m.371317 type:complete len:52 (-) comp58196_c0_seq1:55-210(-)
MILGAFQKCKREKRQQVVLSTMGRACLCTRGVKFVVGSKTTENSLLWQIEG